MYREVVVKFHALTSAFHGSEFQAAAALPPSRQWIRGCLGLKTCLDAVKKRRFCPYNESTPDSQHPVRVLVTITTEQTDM
jgi:hypothetical protein